MTAKPWINLRAVQNELVQFFEDNKSEINSFGSTVNQTFEAFVFASMVNWYSTNGWKVDFVQPAKIMDNYVKLKYSTRGRPSEYTYALCTKDDKHIQIRHGLRVATKYHQNDLVYPANVVLDVAVIGNIDLSYLKTDDFVENKDLITFAEAKHMSAFAELIANFVGLVHELKPNHLKAIRKTRKFNLTREHPAPFLYVSGHFNRTGRGILNSLQARRYDVDVYDREATIFGIPLHIDRIVEAE